MTVVIQYRNCYFDPTMSNPGSREKTVRAAARLLRRQGYFGTGLRDVLAEAGAPRGSLYFHFPNGKEEIAAEALALSALEVRQAIASAATASATAEEFLLRIARAMALNLQQSDFIEGCPIAPTALELGKGMQSLAIAIRTAFQGWEQEIAAGLRLFAFDADHAERLATASLSLLEGALLLSRSYRSIEPMQRAEQVLSLLLRAPKS